MSRSVEPAMFRLSVLPEFGIVVLLGVAFGGGVAEANPVMPGEPEIILPADFPAVPPPFTASLFADKFVTTGAELSEGEETRHDQA